MSNYRKTMTEALQEMVSLDERMRIPRQLIDTNKEVMIVKKNKVIVIDKKDQDKYMKQGWELAEEVGLNEGTIDKVKEIASKKSAKKIDGVMVDSFTASAISQIYDKVNDANKKKMEKLPITKLANLAFKMMQKNEFVPEEVDLDEKAKYTGKLMKNKSIVDYVKKQQEKNRKDVAKFGNKKVGAYGNEPRFDSGSDWLDMTADEVKLSSMSLNKRKAFDPEAEYEAIARKLGLDKFEPKLEDVDLDEGTKQVLAHGGKGKYKVTKDGDKIEIKFGGKVVGTADFDRGADSFFVSIKGERGQKSFDDAQAIADYFAKNKITEEVDLDEGSFIMTPKQAQALIDAKSDELRDRPRLSQLIFSPKELQDLVKKHKDLKDLFGKTAMKKGARYDTQKVSALADTGRKKGKYKTLGPDGKIEEELDLDEGKMSQLHQYIKDKKSPEQIAKLMKLDVKTVKALMNSHHPEEVEESAASDARRAMRRDKDFSRRDSADDDTDATADDVKGASKNIMMQMRKAQSLNGRFDVEFADGKKVKIPAKMAIAVQSKYNKMRRPAEKEKFQAKVGKSYRDMLSALKEAVSPAQQAAIAISKKERGEKPKKESVLDRIDRKIKEKNDG